MRPCPNEATVMVVYDCAGRKRRVPYCEECAQYFLAGLAGMGIRALVKPVPGPRPCVAQDAPVKSDIRTAHMAVPVECIGGPFDGEYADGASGPPEGYVKDTAWGERRGKRRQWKFIYTGAAE